MVACHAFNEENATLIRRTPSITPDYKEVTVPVNMAPLNFVIDEPGAFFQVKLTGENNSQIRITSSNGKIKIPISKWKKILTDNTDGRIKVEVFTKENNRELKKFAPFHINIVKEEIDSYLVYRLIHPGYYNWSEIKIVQRSLENFKTHSLLENQTINKNCINCHAFNQNNGDQFLIHIRGSHGGTYFMDKDKLSRHDLKTDAMPGSATYPTWHPSGEFVAFSSNQVRQNFYSQRSKSIEVYDLISSLILYDRSSNEITNITDTNTATPLQTFPSWSPDGKYLYYCDATFCDSVNLAVDATDIENIHYNLKRRAFNIKDKSFKEPELIFDAAAINKSVSFPRISPDGKYAIITVTDFGTFPIWHKEADLHLINLENGEHKKLALNSDETESYHSWSSNGKWIVFSSKRIDKRAAVPFFSYFESWETIGKPFALPQKDPALYNHMLESFNIPELVRNKVNVTSRNFEKAVKQSAKKAKKEQGLENIPQWTKRNKEAKRSHLEKGIHE